MVHRAVIEQQDRGANFGGTARESFHAAKRSGSPKLTETNENAVSLCRIPERLTGFDVYNVESIVTRSIRKANREPRPDVVPEEHGA